MREGGVKKTERKEKEWSKNGDEQERMKMSADSKWVWADSK